MCGIFCLISQLTNSELLQIFNTFKENLLRRGPDSFGYKFVSLGNTNILACSSVLWLQGLTVIEQPVQSPSSVFLYNGDIFGGKISEELRRIEGDTKLLWSTLEHSSNIIETLENIHGPYAFIYIDMLKKQLYFARDPYGRRSLLIGKNKEQIIITSVAKRNTDFEFIEYAPIGIISIDLNSGYWTIYPWRKRNSDFQTKLNELEKFIGKSIDLNSTNFVVQSIKYYQPTVDDLILYRNILSQKQQTMFEYLLNNSEWLNRVEKLHYYLQLAVKKRLQNQPQLCRSCKDSCVHSITGILFSGGVDCAILAFLAHQLISKDQTIDLMNVSFDEKNNFNSPDRLTGLATLQELQSTCSDRQWNFIEINVGQLELQQSRMAKIADLIYPLNTVLDDSLGCALWFATRGQTSHYISSTRVVLVGMGADELFGGYSRHRAALQKQGWQGLFNVLEGDWENLPYRNLARDDRIVGDHGRQLRTPYLDEDLVTFVKSLHPWQKTWPIGQKLDGLGEKILLRSLAYYLGLKNAAKFQKRALQFGSRIANSKEKAHEISKNLQL